MRKINCLLVPTPEKENEYLMIQFPECEKTIAELANVNNAELVAKIGTHSDPFLFTTGRPELDFPGLIIHETYMVRCFQSAIDHYGIITKT